MNWIRVIIKRTDEEIGHVANISNTLKNLQGHVGGYIEAVTAPSGDYAIICNEDGRICGLPHNCKVKLSDSMAVDFVGDIVVVGVNGEEFCDLPERITRKAWKEMVL